MHDLILSALPAGTSVPTALLALVAMLAAVALAIVAGVIVTRLVALVAARRHTATTPAAPLVIRNAQRN